MKIADNLAAECGIFAPDQVATAGDGQQQAEYQTKKYPVIADRVSVFKAWRCPTLTWGGPTLPSALSGFTSEFEMGSGGSRLLLPPGKLVEEHSDEIIPSLSRDLLQYMKKPRSSETGKPSHSSVMSLRITPKRNAWGYMVKPHGQLVLVSFTHY